MTHEMCRHYTVDGSAYCDHCRDEWYIDSVFDMNGHSYRVWQFCRADELTGEAMYICRRTDGNGSIHLNVETIDEHIGQTPYWAPQPSWHDEY
jgi:hypothetical protein